MINKIHQRIAGFEMGNPAWVIPPETPWYWRWSWRALKTCLIYRKMFSDSTEENESERIILLQQKISAAQFSCKYGREGSPLLRAFVANALAKRAATHSQLRRLIYFGDLSLKRHTQAVTVGYSLFSIGLGVALFLTLSVAVAAFAVATATTHVTPGARALLYVFVASFCMYNLWELYHTVIKQILLIRWFIPRFNGINR